MKSLSSPTRLASFLVTSALVLGVAGCDAGHQVAEMGEATGTETVPDVVATDYDPDDFAAEIAVEDQTSDGDTVTIQSAAISPVVGGWVAVFTNDEEAPDELIGYQQLETELETITIELEQPLEDGEHVLWAQVHVDADPYGTFQWPGSDVPITRGEDRDEVVQERFTVTVGPGG